MRGTPPVLTHPLISDRSHALDDGKPLQSFHFLSGFEIVTYLLLCAQLALHLDDPLCNLGVLLVDELFPRVAELSRMALSLRSETALYGGGTLRCD